MIETIITSALGIVAALAPGVLAAATNKESDADAIAHVLTYVRAMPKREASGGDSTAGGWDRDLAAREAGGTGAPSVPADPYGSES